MLICTGIETTYATKVRNYKSEKDINISKEIEKPSNVRHIDLGTNFKFRKDVHAEEVRELRYYLFRKGYNVDPRIYSYDQELMSIIKEYQKSEGLIADGYAGDKTLEKINEDIERNRIYIPKLVVKTKQTTEVPKGDWVIINKESNTLYHMQGRKEKEKYHVATGSSPSKTPEGKFTVVIRLVDPYWGGAGKSKPVKGGDPSNPLGSRWLGLSIGGGGSYGIHGNSSFNSIGKYASMGCIRMYNEKVEELYENIPNGTPVWIGSAEKLDEYGVKVDWQNRK